MKVLFALIATVCAAGQGTFQEAVKEQDVFDLNGLVSGSGWDLSRLTVEIVRSKGTNPLPIVASVSGGGAFTLTHVPKGSTLRVLDALGNEITSQQVVGAESVSRVHIDLPEVHGHSQGPVLVSAAELKQPRPSKKALKAFEEGKALLARGNHAAAAAAFQKAVEAADTYIDAHANLGTQFLFLAKYQEAVVHLRRAVELDPHQPAVQSNLAFALLQLDHWEEAEHWARSSVKLGPDNVKSVYMLGMVLVERPQTEAEGIRLLEKSASRFPAAHWSLAQIHGLAGRTDAARREAAEYLATGPGNRSQVEGWMKSLR